MSQMMQGFVILNPSQILKIPKKDIIVPRFKNLLRNQNFNKARNSEAQSEQVMIMNLIKKLTQTQLQQIQKQNNLIIRRKFDELKRKMRKSVEINTNQKTINQFFQPSRFQIGLSNYIRQTNYEKIDICKKYRTIIVNRMSTMQQIRTVQKNKKDYRKWYDSRKNSHSKSPNFKRMSFALEKLGKNKQDKNQNKQQITFNSISRDSSHQRILTTRQKSCYASRSKIISFHKKMLAS